MKAKSMQPWTISELVDAAVRDAVNGHHHRYQIRWRRVPRMDYVSSDRSTFVSHPASKRYDLVRNRGRGHAVHHTVPVTPEIGERLVQLWKTNQYDEPIGYRTFKGIVKLLNADEGLQARIEQATEEAKQRERQQKLERHNRQLSDWAYEQRKLVQAQWFQECSAAVREHLDVINDRLARIHRATPYPMKFNVGDRVYVRRGRSDGREIEGIVLDQTPDARWAERWVRVDCGTDVLEVDVSEVRLHALTRQQQRRYDDGDDYEDWV